MNAEHPVRVEAVPTTPNGSHPHPHPHAAQAQPRQATQTPLIDIHEGPEGLVLEADLPGVAQDGVTIHLEENVLTLTARVDPPLAGEARVLHEEYRPADFQRSFILSDEVDRERITADLNNGVLRLSLPKAERAKTRRIEIKSS
jgi:HSP20 family molecular chaperone IbpA